MLRPATADDYYRFYGRPWRWPVIAGLVADSGWMLDGIGGLYQREDGSFWVFLSRAPGVVNRRELAKAAREIMALVDQCGVAVNAYADPRIPGADKLLAHLGFDATETIENELRVWTRGPNYRDSDNSNGRLDGDRGIFDVLGTERCRQPDGSGSQG